MSIRNRWILALFFVSTSCLLYFIPSNDPMSVPINPSMNCTTLRLGYCIIVNYIVASQRNNGGTVTLTTIGDVTYLHHLRVTCRRWKSPMSVAVYTPGTDFNVAKSQIEKFRICDSCIRDWVSWHLVFDIQYSPHYADVTEILNLSTDCSKAMSKQITQSFKHKMNLEFPINMLRNVARQNVYSKFVFASDMELYPSVNIVPRFMEMMSRRSEHDTVSSSKDVYVLPQFEIDDSAEVPEYKSQLRKLWSEERAVSMKKIRCEDCHRTPNLESWMRAGGNASDILDVFLTTKRLIAKDLGVWEPVFIGTTDDPLYQEGFMTNDKMDKFSQSQEMCLLDYNFHILDDAFVVHPGFEQFGIMETLFKTPYYIRSARLFRKSIRDLHRKYEERKRCWINPWLLFL